MDCTSSSSFGQPATRAAAAATCKSNQPEHENTTNNHSQKSEDRVLVHIIKIAAILGPFRAAARSRAREVLLASPGFVLLAFHGHRYDDTGEQQ